MFPGCWCGIGKADSDSGQGVTLRFKLHLKCHHSLVSNLAGEGHMYATSSSNASRAPICRFCGCHSKQHYLHRIATATRSFTSMAVMTILAGWYLKSSGPAHTGPQNSHRYPAPLNQDPLTIFRPMINVCLIPAPWWVHVDSAGLGIVLLFTDGAAINNGQPNQKPAVVLSSFLHIHVLKVSHFILKLMMDHLYPIVQNCWWWSTLSCYMCGWEKALLELWLPQIQTTLSMGYVNTCSLGHVEIGPWSDTLLQWIKICGSMVFQMYLYYFQHMGNQVSTLSQFLPLLVNFQLSLLKNLITLY